MHHSEANCGGKIVLQEFENGSKKKLKYHEDSENQDDKNVELNDAEMKFSFFERNFSSAGLLIFNHAMWSTHPVLSRYLLVKASPTMNSLVILSSAKFTAMVLLYLFGDYLKPFIGEVLHQKNSSLHHMDSSNEELSTNNDATKGRIERTFLMETHQTKKKISEKIEHGDDSLNHQHRILDESSFLCDTNNQHVHKSSQMEGLLQNQKEIPKDDSDSFLPREFEDSDEQKCFVIYRNKPLFYFVFGVLATCRAAFNIESAKYTKPYYICLINSFTLFFSPFADKIILEKPLPPVLWPAVIVSLLSCILIALSQTSLMTSNEIVFFKDDIIGGALQIISLCFIVAIRLISSIVAGKINHKALAQSANFGTFFYPAVYVSIFEPSAWLVWFSMTWKTFFAWSCTSVIVFFLAATIQIGLIQSVGAGIYSSFTAIRVAGAVFLSSVFLGEPIQNWLEWLGIVISIGTIIIYTWFMRRDDGK